MFHFEVDPAKPNNPNRSCVSRLTPLQKLIVTVDKSIKGLPYRHRVRLTILSHLSGIPNLESHHIPHGIVEDILDRIFPLWDRDVYYPPLETRKALRAMGEYLSARLVEQYGLTPEWIAFYGEKQ